MANVASGFKAAKILLFVLVIGGVIGLKLFNQSKASHDVKQSMHEVVAKLPSYETDRGYYDAILDDAHESAFDSAYSPGSRRRAATFDEKRYMELVTHAMKQRATRDGKEMIAAELALLRAMLLKS